jgi:hypothetical protein
MPAEHEAQELDAAAAYWPAAHAAHEVELTAPVEGRAVPDGQLVHDIAPAAD